MTFLVVITALYVVFRGRLQVAERDRRYVMELDARASIEDPAEMRRTLPVLLATILGFFVTRPCTSSPRLWRCRARRPAAVSRQHRVEGLAGSSGRRCSSSSACS